MLTKLPRLQENPSSKDRVVPCRRADITNKLVTFHSSVNTPNLEQQCVSKYLRLLLVLPHSAHRNESFYIFKKEKSLMYILSPSVRDLVPRPNRLWDFHEIQ